MKIISTLFVAFCFANGMAQTKMFTLDDSLRGAITPEREWWDLTYYHLDVNLKPETKSVAGSVAVHYTVLKSGQQAMQIDLQPPLTLNKVTQDGHELSLTRRGTNAYIINLVKPQETGKNEAVIIEYSGKPMEAKNPPWQGGMQWTYDRNGKAFVATSCQGLGSSVWWPCKDHMYDEPDSMLISVTTPRDLMDVSNGRLRKVTDNPDGTRTFSWFVGNPINNYGVNLNVGDYVHFSDTLHGEAGVLDLDYYVLRYNESKAREQFKQVKLMLKAFEYWFGPYPFYGDGYKLVEVPYLGMEHQSSVTYGNGYQNGYRGRDLSGTGWGLKWDFIIIHESGHEWFANNITYKDVADMWVHEGFTCYSETLFTDYYYGTKAGNEYNQGLRKNIRNDRLIIGEYNVNKSGSGDMYPRAANMIHAIRHSIDDDSQFRNILRGLNKTFYHQTVTTQQIEDFISAQAKFNYAKVFDQYLRTVQVPVFEYYVDGKTVRYRWTNCVKGFNLPLALREGKESIKLNATDNWQSAKLTTAQVKLLNESLIEKLYYVTVKRSATDPKQINYDK